MKIPKPDPNHDRDRDRGHDNDNGTNKGAVIPAPASGAMTSLVALEVMMNGVDTSSVVGRSGLPLMQFKRDGNGTWQYGQKATVVEEGSRWAVNPTSFKWGFICFNDNNKPAGERLVSVSQPKPDVAELPDKGFEWNEQWSVNMKCISGADAGVEVVYKPTTVGGIQAVASLINAIRDRLNSGKHDGKVAPIARPEKDSYQHAQYGRVWTPLLTIVDWMPLEGPAPAPAPKAPPSPPTSDPPQPRRRRVA